MSDDSAIEIDDASSFEDNERIGGDSFTVDEADGKQNTKGVSHGLASKGVLSLNKNADNLQKTSAKGTKKTVEETYQKKTMREHILLRPDTYSTLPTVAVSGRRPATSGVMFPST
jgi:hypothetical protein